MLLAFAASTGCSLLVSTSGLTSDGTSPPSPDGATDAIATSDVVSTPDAPEASVDGGGADGEGGLVSPCASTHLFCDDFDRTNAPVSGWSFDTVTAGASLAISPSRAVTLPGALMAKAPRRASSDAIHYATLSKYITRSAFTKAVISWDMYAEKPTFETNDINVGVACFGVRANNMRGRSCMSLGPDYTTVLSTNLGPWKWDRWVHVELTLPTAGAPSIRLDDGAPTTGTYEVDVLVAEPEIGLELGTLSYNKPAPPLTVYNDNVVIDAF